MTRSLSAGLFLLCGLPHMYVYTTQVFRFWVLVLAEGNLFCLPVGRIFLLYHRVEYTSRVCRFPLLEEEIGLETVKENIVLIVSLMKITAKWAAPGSQCPVIAWKAFVSSGLTNTCAAAFPERERRGCSSGSQSRAGAGHKLGARAGCYFYFLVRSVATVGVETLV